MVGAHSIAFEDVDEIIDADDELDIDLTIDYDGVDDDVADTRSGQWLTTTGKLYIVYEGEQSGHISKVEKSIGNNLRKNVVFPSVPTVSIPSASGEQLSNGDMTLYKFTISADDEGPVYVKQVTVTPTLDNGDCHQRESEERRHNGIQCDSKCSEQH